MLSRNNYLDSGRPLNAGGLPQRGNRYQVELPALRGVAFVQSAFCGVIEVKN